MNTVTHITATIRTIAPTAIPAIISNLENVAAETDIANSRYNDNIHSPKCCHLSDKDCV